MAKTVRCVLVPAFVLLLAVLATGCGDGSTSTAQSASPTSSVSALAPSAPASAPSDSVAPAPQTTAPAPAPAPDQGPERCTTAELSAALGPGDAGAGSAYRPLVFTNTGSRSCELRGFPGVSFVAGTEGHQVGPAAEMSGPRGPQVVLAPGGTAIAPVQLVQVGNFDPAACQPTEVRGLRVYPPGDTASLYVEAPGTGCAGTPPGPQLTVQTMARP